MAPDLGVGARGVKPIALQPGPQRCDVGEVTDHTVATLVPLLVELSKRATDQWIIAATRDNVFADTLIKVAMGKTRPIAILHLDGKRRELLESDVSPWIAWSPRADLPARLDRRADGAFTLPFEYASATVLADFANRVAAGRDAVAQPSLRAQVATADGKRFVVAFEGVGVTITPATAVMPDSALDADEIAGDLEKWRDVWVRCR